MNKWEPAPHKLDESKTYKETAKGEDMLSLRAYLQVIGRPLLFFSVFDNEFVFFEFDSLKLQTCTRDTFKGLFENNKYRWMILGDKELYVSEKGNSFGDTYTYIPMAPVNFNFGGIQ